MVKDTYITGLMPRALAKPTAPRRNMNTPRRLTTQQTSEWLGLPEATLRWYRHRGDRGPRSYCLGSRIFYDLVDVEEWAEAQKAATAKGGLQ
jgi:Helix-turn-helix domain